jgi:hypothetical protein
VAARPSEAFDADGAFAIYRHSFHTRGLLDGVVLRELDLG